MKMIETEIHTNPMSNQRILYVKAHLDDILFEKFDYEGMNGLADRVAQKIADALYPEMEKRIMSDPQFKERIINDVLLRIADKLARKRIKPTKKKV